MIGVGYDLFWDLCPTTLRPFVKAFKLKYDNNNIMMWTQGRYIQLAIASCLSDKIKYPTEPFSRNKAEDIDMQTIIKAKFKRRMALLNDRFKEG